MADHASDDDPDVPAGSSSADEPSDAAEDPDSDPSGRSADGRDRDGPADADADGDGDENADTGGDVHADRDTDADADGNVIGDADGGAYPTVDPAEHTVRDLREVVSEIGRVEDLRAIDEAERAGKDRKTAHEAIERRIRALGAAVDPGATDATGAAGGEETDEETDGATVEPGRERGDGSWEEVAAAARSAGGGTGAVGSTAGEREDASEGPAETVGAAAEAAAPDAESADAEMAETETGEAEAETEADLDAATENSIAGDPEYMAPTDERATTSALDRKTGPESDQEMPLTEHIREMMRRLAVVMAVVVAVAVLVFPVGEEIIWFLWESALARSPVPRPRIYNPPELLITQIKVASLAGVILALPVLVYQTYRFMRPGLFPHERRYYLAAVPSSLILAVVGLTFAHFIVVPTVFTYFLQYTEQNAEIAFALGQTFNLILVLMGYLALVFQIPLFMLLAMMLGLVTRQWMADRRLLFWGGFLGISFFFSPDPTGMSPIIIALTMVTLFEGTLALVKWTGRG